MTDQWGDGLARADYNKFAALILTELHAEFDTLKWIGVDKSWDDAIDAVQKEIREHFGTDV